MDNIVSSTLTADPLIDGRMQVHEIHTDILGISYTVDYIASKGDDLNSALVVHAVNLGNGLMNAEINNNVSQILSNGLQAQRTFNYSQQAQSVMAGAVAFASATLAQALMMVDFLSAQTNTDLSATYQLSTQQITNLRSLPSLSSLKTMIAGVAASQVQAQPSQVSHGLS